MRFLHSESLICFMYVLHHCRKHKGYGCPDRLSPRGADYSWVRRRLEEEELLDELCGVSSPRSNGDRSLSLELRRFIEAAAGVTAN